MQLRGSSIKWGRGRKVTFLMSEFHVCIFLSLLYTFPVDIVVCYNCFPSAGVSRDAFSATEIRHVQLCTNFLLVWFLYLTRISIIVDITHKFLDKITHDIGQRKLRFWSIRLYSQQSLTLDSGHIEYGPTWDEGVGCRHNETCFRVLNSTNIEYLQSTS